MPSISVIICSHNPRREYLRRLLDALNLQTLSHNMWELLLVDNASGDALSEMWDLSWHARSRHVREDILGLTAARVRSIGEAHGELLIFFDDDNVPAANYLEQAYLTYQRNPNLGAFGAGRLEAEFEIEPLPEIRPHLSKLALRTVAVPRWSNNASDYESIPWGPGLCVRRPVADWYVRLVENLDGTIPLDRIGRALFSGGDDLFSWVAVSANCGFGIFPQLQVTHLIPAGRLTRQYLLRMIHNHAFSSSIRHYVLDRKQPQRTNFAGHARMLLHGIINGPFSMKCQWAAVSGMDRAAQFIFDNRMEPVPNDWMGNRAEFQPLQRAKGAWMI